MPNIGEVGASLEAATNSAAEGAWQFHAGIRDQQRIEKHAGTFLESLNELAPLLDAIATDNDAYQGHIASGVLSVGQANETVRAVAGEPPHDLLAQAMQSFASTQNDQHSALERGWGDSQGIATVVDEARAALGSLCNALGRIRGHSMQATLSMIGGISFAEGGIHHTGKYAEERGIPFQTPRLPIEDDYAPEQ